MATQKNHITTTIIIINHKDNPLPLINMGNHIIITIPPNTIPYNPTLEWPKYLHYLENQYTTILSINNSSPSLCNLQIPNTITANILELYNINTKNHLHQITPPPKKIVIYSCAWHNAPNYHHMENNHPTPPLPIELYNTYPLKFKPQQCIYTNGLLYPLTNMA